MAMANAAKELIESNVHYQDGTPVECVISPCTIGSGAEAAKCNDYFSTQNVCATLAVTPCWCYGSETMDLNSDTVKAVWGFNGTERPGAVYLAAVMAALHNADFLHFRCTDTMCRTLMITQFLKMLPKK